MHFAPSEAMLPSVRSSLARVSFTLATPPSTSPSFSPTTRFTVAYDKLRLNAYVHSVALPIPKEATNLGLTLDKGVLAQAGGVPSQQALTAAVQVPGLYSLQVADAAVAVVTNERYEPEQVLTINSSQLVHEREMAKAVTAWLLPLQNPRLGRPRRGQRGCAQASDPIGPGACAGRAGTHADPRLQDAR